jgi:hypothetical protein
MVEQAGEQQFKVVDPKVDFLGYGPTLKLIDAEGKEIILSPDDLVYGAAGVTYKGMKFIDEVIELKKDGVDFQTKRDKATIKSVGAGHASMSTSQGMWVAVRESSKLVDSIFTGATYLSALMPSGRRVPIEVGEIVVPKGIEDVGGIARELYLDTSKKNIQAYELLQIQGVPKQEASKIVQYGHGGGGFFYVPLETLVYFAKQAEANPEDIPLEAKEIITQLEKTVHENGMGVTYESRKNAPRASSVNPNIFHHRRNFAQELFEDHKIEYAHDPILLSAFDNVSDERTRRIIDYLQHRKELFQSPGENWKKSLQELEDIVSDFNLSTGARTIANVPWRVWGEVKRHRTLPQTAESIYNAIERTRKDYFTSLELTRTDEEYVSALKRFVSVPDSVANNRENLDLWEERVRDSLIVYDRLLQMGIKESDAITVIPRGIKFAMIKSLDLYNMTTGFASLRQCKGTVEPEMYSFTKREMELIKKSPAIDEYVKQLIAPKCHYGGFCPEADFKTCCGLVKQVTPNYDEVMHKAVWTQREGEIRSKL